MANYPVIKDKLAMMCVCVCIVCGCVCACMCVCGCVAVPAYRISNIAVNVDLAPTMLDMGGVDIPSHMDGTSLLPLLKATRDTQR